MNISRDLMNAPVILGADLRALRKSRGLTLAELAGQLDVSIGWLSQVERNISTPTPDDLARLAGALSVPLSMLLGGSGTPVAELGLIVRAGARRAIGARVPGLVESLLSPDLTDGFEVVHSTFMPGARLGRATLRPTQELAHMIEGKLDIWLDDQAFTVARGDSFRVRGVSLRWANPYATRAIALWVIAPPVY